MSDRHKVNIEVFGIGDPDDPEVYASFVLAKWENSPEARWCREKDLEVRYQFVMQEYMYGQAVSITAWMDGPTYTEWLLKFR